MTFAFYLGDLTWNHPDGNKNCNPQFWEFFEKKKIV